MISSVASVTGSYKRSNSLQLSTTYNASGQIYDGHLSDSSIYVAWVMTPVDSAGTQGEPFLSQWINRNF